MNEKVTGKLKNLREKITGKISADDLFLYPYSNGDINEKRILHLYDRKYEYKTENDYKTRIYFEALSSKDKIVKILQSAPGGRNLFDSQEGDQGYNLRGGKTLNEELEIEQTKPYYSREELEVLEYEINNLEMNKKSNKGK